MRKAKWICGLLMMAVFSLYGQQQADKKNATPGQTQERNDARQSTDTGQDADSLENAAGNAAGTADTPGAAEAAADANSNNRNGGNDASGERASNTPAVSQTTSSGSGSPAVLSSKDGQGRDGTNNVQRASMNMAGSPANNIRLGQTNSVNADNEMRDRQIVEQDKETSARKQKQRSGGSPTGDGSGEINDNTRRENNAASDQNLSAKEKGSVDGEEPAKAEKKSKRRRN